MNTPERQQFFKVFLGCVAGLAAWSMSAAVVLPPLAGDRVERPGSGEAEGFDLGAVRLLAGPFERAQANGAAYLLQLDPDRLLSWFYREADLPVQSEPYGGWEQRGVAGHSLGHYLTACSMMYRATRKEALRERVDRIVTELGRCQAVLGTGYVAAIPEGKRVFAEVARGEIRSQGFDLNGGWVPWYTLHKLMAGLRDAYRFCGNAEALQILERLGDWAGQITAGLNEAQWQQMLACEHGGMNEVLADLYALTGQTRYLELARKFHHRAILDPLAAGRDELAGKHANTQIPKLVGAARLYELTGEAPYAAMSESFWQCVVRQHSYVTGGNSESEHFGLPGRLNDRLSAQTTETCNTHNMLRLTRKLFERRPSVAYADYYERALWNHILASAHPASGMVCYFVPLQAGGQKEFMTPFDSFTCCTGTGMENPARYGEAIYFHDDSTLYVTQFISSLLRWKEKEFYLRMESDLPTSGRVILHIGCDRPVQLDLKIRRPAWAVGELQVRVNGSLSPVPSAPGSWLTLRSDWRDGDVIELEYPIDLRSEPMPDNPNRVALLWGPVVLAGDLGRTEPDPMSIPVLVTHGRPVGKWLKPVKEEPLRFETHKVGRPSDVRLRPFYQMVDEYYAVYWDLLDKASWKRREAELRTEEEQRRQLERRTLDRVRVGEMQPERDHEFAGERTDAGEFRGRKWRHATDGGWFAFDMASDPAGPVDLLVTYWGEDGGNREFDVLIDGRRVATQRLERNRPGEFFDVTYPLPTEATQGKEKVTVRFQAHPERWAGGVFGLRLLRRE